MPKLANIQLSGQRGGQELNISGVVKCESTLNRASIEKQPLQRAARSFAGGSRAFAVGLEESRL